jgi:nicotinate-nucleotide adenylyltransferase
VKTGIFGGTFDPPHVGHLIVAQDAALALGLDRILFIPAAQPPHKQGQDVSAPELRAAMTELAITGDERFVMDRRELDRAGPSYTADTLRELATHEPDTDWTLLMGVDQYAEFGTWRAPEEIRARARLAVLTRPGVADAGGHRVLPCGETRELPDGAVEVGVTRIDISSTDIRHRVASGLPIRYLVPGAVADFIFKRRLYRRNGPAVAG